MTTANLDDFPRASTGIEGLDYILGGGFPRNRMYLVKGNPGAGKTTLAMQFLLAGARAGEPGVYATLSETEEELRDVARSHGWSLDGITICDLQASEESLKADSQYTLFHPSEVELSDTTRTVLDVVEKAAPLRVVFDSLSEIRLLARDSLRYRRQILALKHYFTGRQCTVLLLDHGTQSGEFQLESLAHGVMEMEQLPLGYGGQRRRLQVRKVRGIPYSGGFHDYAIHTGGVAVYPRLVASAHPGAFRSGVVSSEVEGLDTLLGGGADRGSSLMLLGPAGAGKSTICAQYAAAAARRGERAVVYNFDEAPDIWVARADALGMGLSPHIESGLVSVRQVNPAELTPGELAGQLRNELEAGVRLVVLDSLNGYLSAMPDERHLTLHVHEMLSYLAQHGVLTILVMAQYGLVGEVSAPVELSYLADTVVLLRFFEAFGEVRQAISTVKRRGGSHERSIRELRIDPDGIRVGRQLREFHGVLTGRLEYTGEAGPLLAADGKVTEP
ncbi:MAG: circadian clock protein KaiC [Acidobacteriota bacterium]|jgi:circadian clock protein KaiC|nr:circadian clock protein KaiC [Acidobacteriota bacterium]